MFGEVDGVCIGSLAHTLCLFIGPSSEHQGIEGKNAEVPDLKSKIHYFFYSTQNKVLSQFDMSSKL